MAAPRDGAVVILGSGLIGRSWAMLFASGGLQVKLYDVEPQQVTSALESMRKEMELLEQSGALKGSLGAQEQLSLISGCPDLQTAVEGAMHIQECVPENLELKQKTFALLDGIVDDTVVLSSSTSCLLPSKLFAGLTHVKQCIVAHPVNPPYYVPLVELVPHPETDPATVDRTYALMKKIGQSPVRILKEIDGFALNRLQYAVISEAWRLVDEGAVSPGDVDLVMSDGLGMRYAFMGPLETMHLNADGKVSSLWGSDGAQRSMDVKTAWVHFSILVHGKNPIGNSRTQTQAGRATSPGAERPGVGQNRADHPAWCGAAALSGRGGQHCLERHGRGSAELGA
ncbi:lambda-crystallin homolog [Echinops telfairi]|uniref:Lambda-crystallin homolog n=1 Tax=Echinops telfairi TaxID=9371 RepID=A0ABM1VKX9_ECHTE|nr:lambda-crystallin homolog [Echinops telfairi]